MSKIQFLILKYTSKILQRRLVVTCVLSMIPVIHKYEENNLKKLKWSRIRNSTDKVEINFLAIKKFVHVCYIWTHQVS